jgi:hypothetical protein
LSDIRVDTISAANGTDPVTLTGQYAARAWVNFNSTGTLAVRQSGNISSVTDNGVGLFTLNFTTAMTDANYAVVGSGGNDSNDLRTININFDVAPTTSAVQINCTSANNTTNDTAYNAVTVTR